jgi:hypothetical protein
MRTSTLILEAQSLDDTGMAQSRCAVCTVLSYDSVITHRSSSSAVSDAPGALPRCTAKYSAVLAGVPVVSVLFIHIVDTYAAHVIHTFRCESQLAHTQRLNIKCKQAIDHLLP